MNLEDIERQLLATQTSPEPLQELHQDNLQHHSNLMTEEDLNYVKRTQLFQLANDASYLKDYYYTRWLKSKGQEKQNTQDNFLSLLENAKKASKPKITQGIIKDE